MRKMMAAAFLVATVPVLWVLFIGFDRDAGWPLLDNLEGEWVLDKTQGTFSAPPPRAISFVRIAEPNYFKLEAAGQSADFELRGIGEFVFSEVAVMPPLLPPGEQHVFTMTHCWPALPQWDHLIFNLGSDSSRRFIRYERE